MGVGKRHIKPSIFVKLKGMNPNIPTKSLKELYWSNKDVQKGLEGNFQNWKAYYRGQKLKKEGTTSKPINLPKHKKKRFLNKRGTNQPKKTKQPTKKMDARTQTRMEKGTKNKSRKGLKAVKAQASVEPPKQKSSEILDCQGLLCPEQSTSTWPDPTPSGHVDVPLHFTNFQSYDPFGWTVNKIDMSECTLSDHTQKHEPKSEHEMKCESEYEMKCESEYEMKCEYEYKPTCEPVSSCSSGEESPDMIKQSLEAAMIELNLEVEYAPIAVQVKP